MIDISVLQVDSPISYVVALVIPGLDAVIPVLPSETAIIALGVATAGSVDLRIAVLVALAAFGAFLGDNLSYFLGQHFGPRVDRRFFSGEKGTHRHAWAERALEHHGARLIIVCRFIPGGRTAVTLTCGLIGYRHRSFLGATAIAGSIWATYAFFMGRLGGKAFENRPWIGLFLALSAALVVSTLVEMGRRVSLRLRARRDLGSQ